MEKRGQFTFYRSFWEAVQGLPKKDQLPILTAIISYALDGEVSVSLNTSQKAFFALVKPNLDSARKKAANGKQGGSKTQANRKQTGSKKENEKENEIEIENKKENEIEIEIEKESLYLSGDGGDTGRTRAASERELLSIGLKPGEFYGVTAAFVEEVRAKTMVLFATYIPGAMPMPWDYRGVSRYCGSVGRSHLLDYAFEKAAIAGKSGDWRYIDGIMSKLALRDIETVEQARMWDEERPDRDEV